MRVNIRFPGQYCDEETGLHYNRHRYYDPGIGRYISADPIGQAGGVNLYGYAGNSPTNRIDPLGLSPGYFSRVASNIGATNTGSPGVLAPTGTGVALRAGAVAAAEVGSTTAFAWAASGFGSTTMGAATFTAAETGVIVAGTHALAAAAVGVGFEAGVVVGSLVSEAPVLGGGTVGDFWGAALFGAYEDALGALGGEDGSAKSGCENGSSGNSSPRQNPAPPAGPTGGFRGFLGGANASGF